jgi:hypothetical protein
MDKTMKYQVGVSVIELALVICIAALLWGGVLLFNGISDRVLARTLGREMLEVKAALHTYRDRYGAVPGDDSDAPRHVPGAGVSGTSLYARQADGLIVNVLYDWANTHSFFDMEKHPGGPFYDGSPVFWHDTPEQALFWNHVRLAGIVQGDPVEYPVRNAVHGYLGITSDLGGVPARPAGVTGVYNVCSSMIDGRIARMMDQNLDDGLATSGQVWATTEKYYGTPVTTKINPVPYVDGSPFTVCMAF